MVKPQRSRTGEPPVAADASPPVAGRSFTSPARAVATRRRPALIAAGVALVVVGALAMVAITSSLGKTHQVLAVTGHLSRGDVIGAKDLAVAELPAGPSSLAAVTASSLDDVVGQRAAVELAPGSLLTPGSYASSLVPGEGSSVVGVSLEPAKMPVGAVRSGDSVRLVSIPDADADVAATPQAVRATVVSVSESALGDTTVVNVEVDAPDAAALAGRAAAGRIALVLDGAEG